MIEVGLATADDGSWETRDWTAEIKGRSPNPDPSVLDGRARLADADGQFPNKATPSRSQTTLLTADVTLGRGASGTAEVA